MAARAPIPVTVDRRSPDAALPPPLALTAYYVASEALANVAKHAHATRARLELSTAAGELLLRVADDGVGGADPAGAGLSGLRDRSTPSTADCACAARTTAARSSKRACRSTKPDEQSRAGAPPRTAAVYALPDASRGRGHDYLHEPVLLRLNLHIGA